MSLHLSNAEKKTEKTSMYVVYCKLSLRYLTFYIDAYQRRTNECKMGRLKQDEKGELFTKQKKNPSFPMRGWMVDSGYLNLCYAIRMGYKKEARGKLTKSFPLVVHR